MIASGAVLAFALIPDLSDEYRAALNELAALRQVPLTLYPSFVKGRLRQTEEQNYTFLLSVVRRLNVPIAGKPAFAYSVLCDPPPQGDLRLIDYEKFLVGNHRAAGILIDRNEGPIAAKLKSALANVSPQPSLVGIDIYTPYDEGIIWPGSTRIWEWGQLGNAATNVTTVHFIFSNLVSGPPNIPPIPVTFRLSSIEEGPLAVDWLLSDRFGRVLVDKSGGVFPHLKVFWARVSGMGIESATLFLQDQIESTRRGSLSFFGIAVDRSLVIWAAPGICTCLLLFFVLHFRHLMRTRTANDLGEATAYPWIVSFSDRVSGFVSYVTVLVLPAATNVLLLVKHGSLPELASRAGIVLTVLLALVGCVAVGSVYQFRRSLRERLTVAETVEVTPPAAKD
jgi:hypothetical protein